MTTTEILTGIKDWVLGKLSLKQDVISDLATIRSGAQAGTTAVQPSDLSEYFNDASYDTSTHRINFYHGQNIAAYVDASPFIVDGMVDDVRIENGYLVIDFNTASGKQDISIPLTDIFDPSNYYNKTQTDALLGNKVDKVSGKGLSTNDYTNAEKEKLSGLQNYDDTQVRQLITQTNENFANYYTKAESYSATEVDEALGGKQNTINDLANIRSGASAGATAVQPSVMNTALVNTVAESGVYDVTANNDNAKFASLSALLSSENLNTLIPSAKRKGGMSIKFVLSSDNKYVEYFLTKTIWSASEDDWQKLNLEEEISQLDQEITNYSQILFNIPEEINNAFIAFGKYIQAVQGQQYPARIAEYSTWKLLSIPIVQGVEYVFHYNLWPECSFYVTNNDYTPTSTIVYGRYNGYTLSLTNVVIIDSEKKLASFTSPVNGLFNINFDLRPTYNRLDFVYFRKKSDTSVYNVIGIPENIVDSIDDINNSIDGINDSIDGINDSINSITTAERVQDVELYIPSTINNWGAAPFPSFVGGISKNSKNPAGILVTLKTIKSIPAGNRRIRVYKKNRNSDDNIVSLTTIATYNITSSNDWMELDVSALNIPLIEDVAIGLEVNNNTELGYTGPVPTANQNQILFSQPYGATDANILSVYNSHCGGITFVVEKKVLTIEDSPEYSQLKQQVDTIENAVDIIWSSLNVVMLGDSITELGGTNCDDPDGWTKWFKDRANPLTCKSYAKSGAKMCNQSTTEYDITTNPAQKDNVFYNQINRLINDCNNGQVAPDVIFIAFGTNDSSSPLTPAASTVFTQNTSAYTTTEPVTTMLSIAQSIRYGVEMLYSQFPNVQIMFLSPQQTTWFSIFSVGDEIENSCRYLGIPCLRLDYEAATWSIRERVAYYKTYDGTHTSEIGAKRNGYFIERWASKKLQW